MTTKDLIKLYHVIVEDIVKVFAYTPYKNVDVNTIRSVLERINGEYTKLPNEIVEAVYNCWNEPADTQECILREFDKMQQNLNSEEKAEAILELMDNNIFINVKSILLEEDKNVLLDRIDTIEENKRSENMAYCVMPIDVLKYINKDGKNKDLLIDELIKVYRIDLPSIIVASNYLKDESDRAKICIKLGIMPNEIITNIEDKYIRSRIILNIAYISLYGTENMNYYLNSLEQYKIAKEKLSILSSEEEKTVFICSLKDNEMKIAFLEAINEKKNREKIIDSLENSIDPNLQSEVNLVQTMIKEFFEDSLGEEFTQDKKEKMQMVFNKSRVYYSDNLAPDIMGIANCMFDILNVNSRIRGNTSIVIANLMHEYGHLFSNFNAKETACLNGGCKEVEEGTQDLFEEMVINHYLEKYGSIELDGKKIKMEYPYVSFTAYIKENAWQRTMLYALERDGQDKIALAEYQLGDKNKYLDMVLGRETAEKKIRDGFGNPIYITSAEEIYNANQEKLKVIDKNSPYYRRNWILPEYILHDRLKDKGINLLGCTDERYECSDIASKYFDNKRIYEIDAEEMEEFVDLVRETRGASIVGYDNFANESINKLEERDLNEHSFEILINFAIVGKNSNNFLPVTQDRLIKYLIAEEKKVEEGQDIAESLKKYKEIIPTYKKILFLKERDPNAIIMKQVEDLQYAYLDQLDQALEEDREGTIKAITEAEDSEIWIDKSIAEVLDKHGVVLESTPKTQGNYSVDDVTRIAIKGKFTLGEIEGLGIALESTKESESIRNNETR